jgi:acyl-coenzyme A thioesterase PaaI-like protein
MEGKDMSADSEDAAFRNIPWCRSILEDPKFAVEPTHSRKYSPETGENSFLARTLKTNDTIEAWCSLYRRPTADRKTKDEVNTLFLLNEGLNGYPRVCHGGLVAAILDEVASMLVSECRWSQGLPAENVTADLRLTFVKPVFVPGAVLVNAKVTDIQKTKKYFVKAELVDSEGDLRAKAEGLFICVGREKL